MAVYLSSVGSVGPTGAKWSRDQLLVDLERGLWIHTRPCAQSHPKIGFETHGEGGKAMVFLKVPN